MNEMCMLFYVHSHREMCSF